MSHCSWVKSPHRTNELHSKEPLGLFTPHDEAVTQFIMATSEKRVSVNTFAVRFALLGNILPGCLGSQSFSAFPIQVARHWHLGKASCPASCWAGVQAQSCQLKSPKLSLALVLICLLSAEVASIDLAFSGTLAISISPSHFFSPPAPPRPMVLCELPASV